MQLMQASLNNNNNNSSSFGPLSQVSSHVGVFLFVFQVSFLSGLTVLLPDPRLVSSYCRDRQLYTRGYHTYLQSSLDPKTNNLSARTYAATCSTFYKSKKIAEYTNNQRQHKCQALIWIRLC